MRPATKEGFLPALQTVARVAGISLLLGLLYCVHPLWSPVLKKKPATSKIKTESSI